MCIIYIYIYRRKSARHFLQIKKNKNPCEKFSKTLNYIYITFSELFSALRYIKRYLFYFSLLDLIFFYEICLLHVFVSSTKKLYFVKNLWGIARAVLFKKFIETKEEQLKIYEYSIHSRFDLTSRRRKR